MIIHPAAQTPAADSILPTEGEAAPGRRQWFVQDALPLITSVAVHAAVVVTAVLGARAIMVTIAPPVEEEPPSVSTNDGLQEQVTPVSADTAAKGVPIELRKSMSDAASDAPAVNQALSVGGGADRGSDDDLIALGASTAGRGGTGLVGFGPGNGAAGNGVSMMVGLPDGIGLAKNVTFGSSNNVRRVVFVCDATGTMLNKMATLKSELAKAIDRLKPTQSFNVIFYYDGPKVFALDQGQMLPVNADNKRRAFKFLDDVTPSGPTDPRPALQLAFKLQPQLIHFLSDGEFNSLVSYDEVVGEIKKQDAGGKIRLNTILFQTYDQQAEEVMKQIAAHHHGVYRYVRESDLAGE